MATIMCRPIPELDTTAAAAIEEDGAKSELLWWRIIFSKLVAANPVDGQQQQQQRTTSVTGTVTGRAGNHNGGQDGTVLERHSSREL